MPDPSSSPAFTRSFVRGPAGRTITLACTYAASVAEVWSAVTAHERLARWFGSVLDSPPGSASVVLDVGGIPALVQVDRCEPVGVGGGSGVLDLRLTWQGEPATRVVLRLAGAGPDVTALVLEHSALLVDSHVVGFGSGWEWSLTALAAELAGSRLDEDGLPAHQEAAHEEWRLVYEGAG
ncbi:MAG: hypothetical protein ABI243_09250 [Lapillicoccus sp.]